MKETAAGWQSFEVGSIISIVSLQHRRTGWQCITEGSLVVLNWRWRNWHEMAIRIPPEWHAFV